MNINLILLLLAGGLFGAVSGYLGSFMVVKRMSLVGDALSHVALPGIAIALIYGINPMIGAFVTLLIATIGIWYFSEHSEIYPEALFGVFFTASLAIGLLITPEPDLLEALFGNIDKITVIDGIAVIISIFVIFVITKIISKKVLLGIVSEDLAKSQKINMPAVNLIYLLMVSMVVALGVKFLGTLLTGAMVIIPAVTARNVAKNVHDFQFLSILFGIIPVVMGIILARNFSFSSGPIIVLTSIGIFLVSYVFKRK
jgi:ABC-type Mn2+/Zn2+ transport system permease subunit